MAIIELRESEIPRFDSVHHWLQHKLDLPEWYGHNLDALWDCLSGWIALPIEVHWIREAITDPNSEYNVPLTSFISLFEEASEQIDGFTFKLLSSVDHTAE